MKKRLSILTLLIAIIFVTCCTAYGEEVVLGICDVEVTKDGATNTLYLTGKEDNSRDGYYTKLTLIVQETSFCISLNVGGFNPIISSFGDIDGSGTVGILVSAATGESGGTTNYALATLKNGKLQTMPVPQPVKGITGAFKKGYKAEIKISDFNEMTLDVSSRKEFYKKEGIYKRHGRLVKPVSVMVDTYSKMEFADYKGSPVLEGVQCVSGVTHHDGLLGITSRWQWNGKEWKLNSLHYTPLG